MGIALLIIIGALVAFNLGFLAAWLIFDNKYYKPLKAKLKTAVKGWEESLELARFVAEQKGVLENKEGLILSPFQVKRYGQE